MKELLFSITKKDFEIDYFSGTGKGGQYRNKHQNCVRLFHRDSGVRTTGQSNRERIANTREAFNNLVKHPKFIVWHTRKVKEILDGKNIEQKVDESMVDKNLKVECRNENGNWMVFFENHSEEV
jgi:peptide chain release factor 1